jgi:serine protease Do
VIESDDESFVDIYRVVLASRASLTVELQTGNFDAFLFLVDEMLVDEITADDDGGAGTNALILDLTLDAGTYMILANSVFEGETGQYTLTTSSAEANPACDVAVGVSTNSITPGTLATGDCTLASLVPGSDTSYVDRYRVTLPTGGDLTVGLESDAFDSFLWLLDETLSEVIETDDDGGSGGDSLLSDVPLAAGTYVILANSFDVSGVGNYTLTLTPEPSPTLSGLLALATLVVLSRSRPHHRR